MSVGLMDLVSDIIAVPWIACVILVPLGAAALFFIMRRSVSAPWVALPITGMIIATAGLTVQVAANGPLRYAVGGRQEPLGIVLYADGLSVLMLLMTAAVGACISIYSLGYFRKAADQDKGTAFFWPLWFFLWAALNALFLSADIFNVYVTLELMGLSAVALITISGGRAALNGAMRYLLAAALGSLLYLFGVAVLYGNYGTLGMNTLSQMILPDMPTHAAIAAITAGLLIKTALFPFHFWLPPAHSNAPAPVSALLSGLVVKASYFLLVKLWLGVFSPAVPPAAGYFLAVPGACAILWGSFLAIRQGSLKMLIAYSTAAQLGYLFLLFPILIGGGPTSSEAWNGSVYHLVSHACAKAAMFMAAGNIIRSLGHDRLADMGGVSQRMPITFFAVGLSGVSLMGLPVSGGFTAKWLLLNAAIGSGHWWWVVFIIAGSLMAAGYIFLIWRHGFQVQAPGTVWNPVPRGMEIVALLLSLISVGLGLSADPALRMLAIGSPFLKDPF